MLNRQKSSSKTERKTEKILESDIKIARCCADQKIFIYLYVKRKSFISAVSQNREFSVYL